MVVLVLSLTFANYELGAGFYLNATQEKWKNWKMYDYIVKELPKLLTENFQQLDTSRASISGHSMGGHGALTIYLKNLGKYKVNGFKIGLSIIGFLQI